MSIYMFYINNIDIIEDIRGIIKNVYYHETIYDEDVLWELTEEEMENISLCWRREYKMIYTHWGNGDGLWHYKYEYNGNYFLSRPFGSENPLSNIYFA